MTVGLGDDYVLTQAGEESLFIGFLESGLLLALLMVLCEQMHGLLKTGIGSSCKTLFSKHPIACQAGLR